MDLQEQLLVLQNLFRFSYRETQQKTHSMFKSQNASKPTPNAKLTKFWNSLRGMKPENGFLKFRTKAEYIPTLMESLYIRKAYEDFFNIISESTEAYGSREAD